MCMLIFYHLTCNVACNRIWVTMTVEAPKRPEIIDEIIAETKAQRVEQTLTEEERVKRKALAEGLFELCEDQDFLGLILRRDSLARAKVEVFLCGGDRDDVVVPMTFGEKLVLIVVRQPGREHLGVIIARQCLPNVDLLFNGRPSLPKGKELVIKNKASAVFGSEYESVKVSEWLSGGNYEVTLERRIRSAEELLKTHGSRIDEIVETLKEKVRRVS